MARGRHETLLILRRPRQFAAVVLVSLFALIASQARVSPPHAAEAAVPAASLAAAQIAAPPALANAELPPEAPPPYSNFAELDRSPVGAIATAPAARALAPSASPAPALTPIDLSRFVAAAALNRKGVTAQADSLAAEINDPTQRAALEWIALKGSPAPDGARSRRLCQVPFRIGPASDWIRAVFESSALLASRRARPRSTLFSPGARRRPSAGVLAFARAALGRGAAKGRTVEAVAGHVARLGPRRLDRRRRAARIRGPAEPGRSQRSRRSSSLCRKGGTRAAGRFSARRRR